MKTARILLVDDDRKVSTLVRTILERLGGYVVREENRPYAALHTAREYRPDLIVLDVDMPGQDGGDVAASMRSDALVKGVPIVFLSSLITPADSGVRGGYLYLSKSLEPRALVNALCDVLPAVA